MSCGDLSDEAWGLIGRCRRLSGGGGFAMPATNGSFSMVCCMFSGSVAPDATGTSATARGIRFMPGSGAG